MSKPIAVSYTHLDVYKRQVLIILVTVGINMAFMSLTKRRERGGK